MGSLMEEEHFNCNSSLLLGLGVLNGLKAQSHSVLLLMSSNGDELVGSLCGDPHFD